MTSKFLPPELITEILSRLPVKSLLRFRCVSKPWCSLISSQKFVKKHLNHSINTKTNRNLILGFGKNIFSVSLHSLHLTGVVSPDYVERLSPPFPGSIVLHSCNGLSLVVINTPQNPLLCIWNPFTRKYRELPVPSFEYPRGHDLMLNFMIANERYAFAYVSDTDEYKVVRVVEFSRIDSVWLCSEAKMFSSRSDEWEKIEPFPYRLSYKRLWGAHLNCILHTVVHTDSSRWSILGFDVRSKQHAVVPNPDLGGCEDFDITVEVLGGFLCLIKQHFSNDVAMDVWIMKVYGVKDSWLKLLSVAPMSIAPMSIGHPCGIFPFTRSLLPLAYSEDGEEVLLNEIDERMFWFNLRTKTVREITFNMTSSEFYTDVCFESLVSFPGFISVDNVNGKKHGDLKKVSKEKRTNKKRGISLKRGLKLVL